MTAHSPDVLARPSIFAWLALATGLILLILFVVMQSTVEMKWGRGDFALMGLLLFGTSSLFVLVARRVPRRWRLLTGAFFIAVLVYVWAELAIGIFTNLGS